MTMANPPARVYIAAWRHESAASLTTKGDEMNDKNESSAKPAADAAKAPKPGKPGKGSELSDEQLGKVSGGAVRRIAGGDDDLDDLEVER